MWVGSIGEQDIYFTYLKCFMSKEKIKEGRKKGRMEWRENRKERWKWNNFDKMLRSVKTK